MIVLVGERILRKKWNRLVKGLIVVGQLFQRLVVNFSGFRQAHVVLVFSKCPFRGFIHLSRKRADTVTEPTKKYLRA